jgi:hypothetical protein
VRELEDEDVEEAGPENHSEEEVHDVRIESLFRKVLHLLATGNPLQEEVSKDESQDVRESIPADAEVPRDPPEKRIEVVNDWNRLPPLLRSLSEIRSLTARASNSIPAGQRNPSRRQGESKGAAAR